MSKAKVSVLSFVFLLFTFLILYDFQGAASGAEKVISKEEAKAVLETLGPGLDVISVEKSPVEGVWEVVFIGGGKKGIVYLDSSKKYAIFGSLIDIATKRNITKAKFDEINKVDVSLIPLEDALVLGDTKALHRVIVFDDPD